MKKFKVEVKEKVIVERKTVYIINAEENGNILLAFQKPNPYNNLDIEDGEVLEEYDVEDTLEPIEVTKIIEILSKG